MLSGLYWNKVVNVFKNSFPQLKSFILNFSNSFQAQNHLWHFCFLYYRYHHLNFQNEKIFWPGKFFFVCLFVSLENVLKGHMTISKLFSKCVVAVVRFVKTHFFLQQSLFSVNDLYFFIAGRREARFHWKKNSSGSMLKCQTVEIDLNKQDI